MGLVAAALQGGSCADVLGLGPTRHLGSNTDETVGGAASANAAQGGEGLALGGTAASGSPPSDGGAALHEGAAPGLAGADVGASGGAVGPGDAGSGTGGAAGAPNLPQNCTQILAEDPLAKSGVSLIDPDGAGPLPTMQAYCDQQTDGGGWTLVLNYLHQGGTNPELKVHQRDLPLLGESVLGGDESEMPSVWGHASPELIAALAAHELRFWGITSEHNNVIHFKTALPACVSYARTGYLGCRGIQDDFTPLAGHSASLPEHADGFSHNLRDSALSEYPFAHYGVGHWSIRGGGVRWEVDNWRLDDDDTLHRVFVRSGAAPVVPPVDGGTLEGDVEQAPQVEAPLLASCRALKEYDAKLPSGLYQIKPEAQAYTAYCNMQLDGGGWTVFLAVRNGSDNVLAHFEWDTDSCPNPQQLCLRHLPASVDTKVELVASCGSKAVKFFGNGPTLSYLKQGLQAEWQPLTNPVGLAGTDATLAHAIWTGAPGNDGLVIADESAAERTLLASYSWNNAWDYCAGVEEGKDASPIRLMYR